MDDQKTREIVFKILTTHSDTLSSIFIRKLTNELVSNLSNKECCVCYENSNNVLRCSHSVCKTCFNKLCKFECPICRAKLLGLTRRQRRRIEKNIKRAKRETEETDFQEIQNRFSSQSYYSRTENLEQYFPQNRQGRFQPMISGRRDNNYIRDRDPVNFATTWNWSTETTQNPFVWTSNTLITGNQSTTRTYVDVGTLIVTELSSSDERLNTIPPYSQRDNPNTGYSNLIGFDLFVDLGNDIHNFNRFNHPYNLFCNCVRCVGKSQYIASRIKRLNDFIVYGDTKFRNPQLSLEKP
jgi:hypothetical protein